MSENMRGEGPLFPHPFSKAYWLQAASEFKKQRVLIFAALMIALRVVLKSMGIPIAAAYCSRRARTSSRSYSSRSPAPWSSRCFCTAPRSPPAG